ncbi:YdcF family protein [Cupriavidus sp. P-10]|uniref:YdcF family protein n=1 Tax=Cupriavidus sp. P-10 TaxID=2027911 RepID=UPI000EDE325C|nr:YdcF family protein [Cupriavidus sp. P-10]BDB22687.1 YdcF family protein [Cupriavidus sp. P-10]
MRIGLALVGAVLLGDAVALMGMGLFSLGITMPGCIGIAFLLLALCWDGVARWRKADRRRELFWRAGWGAFAVWLVTVGVFFYGIRSGMGVSVPAGAPVKAIVILGSGTPNCEASPTLIARLDQGLVQARRWPEAKVVVSGGQDFGLRCVEADIMADYLVARGIAPDKVFREGRSTSTEENLVFSRRLLEGQGVDGASAIVVVTSDFHVRRAVGIARKAGSVEAFGVGAVTPSYLRFNAWLREYFAAISSWVLREY